MRERAASRIFLTLFHCTSLISVAMSARALWCLGAVVVAAMLRSLPVESQCTAKYCYNDDEALDLRMLLNIQQEMLSMKEEMASMKGEMASTKGEMTSMIKEMKGQISSLKENLTKCCKCCLFLLCCRNELINQLV